jgi:hypothetical protein
MASALLRARLLDRDIYHAGQQQTTGRVRVPYEMSDVAIGNVFRENTAAPELSREDSRQATDSADPKFRTDAYSITL